MTGNGILMYDLAGSWCEECGRAKSFRLWPGTLTGCKTCDEVITRHRCLGRPDSDSLEAGTSWSCPDCGTGWVVTEESLECSECGCCECRTEKRWSVAVAGDRIDTAPRYEPKPGPLDLMRRHPDIPVPIPVRNGTARKEGELRRIHPGAVPQGRHYTAG